MYKCINMQTTFKSCHCFKSLKVESRFCSSSMIRRLIIHRCCHSNGKLSYNSLLMMQKRRISNDDEQKAKNRLPVLNVQNDLATLHENIREYLSTGLPDLDNCCHYYFDGQGKLFRPMTIMLMAKACNVHLDRHSKLLTSQKRMAMIAEMIHTASLLHDDVIDEAETRRNKISVNKIFTHKQTILAGDMIMSRASILLAQLGNTKAVEYYSQIINDLVKGELMQLMTKEDVKDRFTHYILKSFRKTASLIAYSCKAVSLFAGCDDRLQEEAFQYGKNLGISFQLVDDALDFVSSSEAMGKHTGADLKLGLATAPALFAAHKYPDLHALIGRRFRNDGDAEQALEYVNKSDGINETYMLAQKYASEARKTLDNFRNSDEKQALINLTRTLIVRTR